MSKTSWTVICIVGAVAMAAIAVVSGVLGGCSTAVELANGSSMPMKCHWTFVADAFVGVAGAVIALTAITCKEQTGRRAMGVALVMCALVAACLPTSLGVGLCANAEMHCHMTAAIVWVLCAVSAVVGIMQIVKSEPRDSELPKRSL